jgi:hypothetical protein
MKLKITSIFFALVLCGSAAFAQPENVARLGLFSFGMGNVSLSYERVLGEKASAGIYLGYVYNGLGVSASQVQESALPDD